MNVDLTRGPIREGLVRFSLPIIAGNLMQQLYNVVDTWVVGSCLGEHAVAAVGGSFALMVLLTSMLLGLCLGSGVVFSRLWTQGEHEKMRRAMGNALLLCLSFCLLLTAAACLLLRPMLGWMNVHPDVQPDMAAYLRIILPGMLFTLIYNYMAAVERSVGNSVTPLVFLGVSTVLNIVLDVLFVAVCGLRIEGAAWATLIAQCAAAAGIAVHGRLKFRPLLPSLQHMKPDRALMKRIFSVSAMSGLQQSVMNFGILMVQSLVNSFGPEVMAAFAVGVKVDAFAYAPAQDFAGGFSTFVSQNLGAEKSERIRRGTREAFILSAAFCAVVSMLVAAAAPALMRLFIRDIDTLTLETGVQYLRIEGLCYVGIGVLFLLYAAFRGMERPAVSLLLTVISLGLRVVLAYTFAPAFGPHAIWWSIPIGWAAADLTGLLLLRRAK